MEQIWGIVRTVLAATAGAWAVKAGYMDGDQLNAFLGGLGVVVVSAWSVVQKVQASKKIAAAQSGTPPVAK